MLITSNEKFNYRYTFGSLITLSIQFKNDNGVLFDPINPKVTVLSETTRQAVIKGGLNRITTGYYFYNIERLNIGRYEVIYSALEKDENNNAIETTLKSRVEVLPILGKQILPIDPLSKLRIDLRDNNTDPDYWIWTDIELEEYLNQALGDINITPPRTCYSWHTVPDNWIQCIKRGAMVRALTAKSIEVAHYPVSYTDKGVTLDKRAQAQFYKTLSDGIDTRYTEEKRIIKRNHYPGQRWITTNDVPYQSMPPIRSIGRVFY